MRLFRDHPTGTSCPDHGPLNGQTKCRFCDFTIFMPEAVSSSSRNGLGTSAPTAPNGGAAPIFSSQYDELNDFAAAALQGVCANNSVEMKPHDAAAWAYRQADAMLAERDK